MAVPAQGLRPGTADRSAADRFRYDSFDDLMDLVTEAMFDPETVNERLADI